MDTIESVKDQLETINKKEMNVIAEIDGIKVAITKCRARLAGVETIAEEQRRFMLKERFATDLNNLLQSLKLTEEKLSRVSNAKWWATRTLASLELAAVCRKDGALAHNPFLALAQGFGPK